MECPRCQGLMVKERIPGDDEGFISIHRCINCGEVLDEVIAMRKGIRVSFFG